MPHRVIPCTSAQWQRNVQAIAMCSPFGWSGGPEAPRHHAHRVAQQARGADHSLHPMVREELHLVGWGGGGDT
jgi:hypothetical protein